MSKALVSLGREFVSGLSLVSRGKVRDTYTLPDNRLLTVATDRVSIFDFVLPGEVSQKGEVLTALNVFWFLELAKKSGIPQDVIAFGSTIDEHLPKALRDDQKLQKRATIVRKLRMIPVEAVVRGCITGSGWNAYRKTAPQHMICGHSLPPELNDGDQLPEPIFTPTTKATEGHDEHMDFEEVGKRFGFDLERSSLRLFKLASQFALERGIVIADTKLEFGTHPTTDELVLGDERFTPDSSRFWLRDDWERSRKEGKSPTSFDKQVVRNWGKIMGVDKLNPLNPEDLKRVSDLTVPADVITRTMCIYRYIFFLITGKRLEAFQRNEMGISASLPPVEIVIGSESDIPQIERGLNMLRGCGVRFRVHVISCHRNPGALWAYAKSAVPPNATVIAAAGKAAALPGMLHSLLQYHSQKHIPVIGVALEGKDEEDLLAAQLSISRLPGTPVIMKAKSGPYTGPEGFLAACEDAVGKEFFMPATDLPKEPKRDFIVN